MESEAKVRGSRSRRRERAARMQKQALRCQSGDDESPGRSKAPRPPNRKKRNKESVFEEDVIDGFAILSFRTYEDLESTIKRHEPETRPSSPEPVLNNKIHCNDKNSVSPTPHKNKNLPKVRKGPRVASEQNARPPAPGPEVPTVNRAPRSTSRDRLSDGSTRSSSGRGYMCDSESESERASDAGSDIFAGPQCNPRRPPSLKTSSPAAPCAPNACPSPSRGPSPVSNGPSWPPEPPAAALTPTSSAAPVTTSAPSPPVSALAAVGPSPQRPPRVATPPVVTSAPPSCEPPVVPPPPTSQPSLVSELLSQPPFLPAESLNGGSSNGSLGRDFTSSTSSGRSGTPTSVAATTASGAPLRNGSVFTNSSLSPLLASHLVHTTSSVSAGSTASKPVTPAPGAPAPAPLFPFSLVQSRASPPQGYLATPTQPSTPTPSLGSSHSNSSLSSLSQLSQSLQGKESGRSSSRNNTPALGSLGTATTPCCAAASFPGGTTNSLTSLVFSKPWVSPSANSYVASANGPHLATPPVHHRPTPPLPTGTLPSGTLPSSHHPFASHPPLHPHPGMFAPPIPPPAPTLTSPSIGLPSGPTGFVADTPLLPNQDLLRRELDTRFLASQDRSINIPPPPYMRTELHQHHHQHQHMHQHSPFLPPTLGSALMPPGAQHLYEKFHPKLDSPFYPRNALGLSGYTGLSPLLNPGVSTTTPFVAPGHLAAFQPKMSSLVKNKAMKSGRWCAMHVRIAWEIYNHQQKQQVDTHKTGHVGPSQALTSKNDLLRPPNHLYSSLPRPHDLGPFPPSALLGAAGAPSHTRPHFEGNFLTPNPSHIGMTRLPSTSSGTLSRNPSSRVLPPGISPFARPSFPGFGTPPTNSYGSLGALGLTGGPSSLFSSRDLGASPLGAAGADPWSRLHRSPSFPGPLGVPTAAPERTAGSAWGGLKAEAERERIDHENEKQRKLEAEKERKEREAAIVKAKELEREKKAQEERQRERDRENRLHHLADGLMRNGDYYDPGRGPLREREPHRDRAQHRDPLHGAGRETKNDGAFDGSKAEVRVKEERRDEEPPTPPERKKPVPDHLSRPENDFRPLPQHFLGGLPPNVPPDRGFWGVPGDPYRLLDLHSAREVDREQLLQQYHLLGPVVPLHGRFREGELERLALERELQSKLPPPPLRPADPGGGFPPRALFPPLQPPAPYLNSLTGLAARNKNGSPAAASTPGGGGIPPPLIPCSSGAAANHAGGRLTPPVHHKMGSLVEHEAALYAKDRRDPSNHRAATADQMR